MTRKPGSIWAAVLVIAVAFLSGTQPTRAMPAAAGQPPDVFIPIVFGTGTATGPIVVDHRHTDVSKIPDYWIEKARQFVVHYAHTSHGSQVLSGLNWLEGRNPKYNVEIVASGSVTLPSDTTALRFYDGNNYPSSTYITPDMYWDSEGGRSNTRSVLDTGWFDFSLWTWCGQMSSTSTNVPLYLSTLSLFQQEVPAVRSIFFTGHTDGTAPGSELWKNNNEVREYVQQHGGILFDFADIESYDPAGQYYPTVSDSCSWCASWCSAHPNNFECQNRPSCAHTHGLQCTLKSQAFWWMMARLAGWDGVLDP